MIDLVLRIETTENGVWQVQTGSVRQRCAPLTDEDLRTALISVKSKDAGAIAPAAAFTWNGFLDYLAPGADWAPGRTILDAVGRLLHDHFIRGDVAGAVHDRLEAARAERTRVRLVVHVWEGEEDGLLVRLPFELMVREGAFWLRGADIVGVRLPPRSTPTDVDLRRGARVILAGATVDDRRPSRDEMVAHLEQLEDIVAVAGWKPHTLIDCTLSDLEAALREGCDALYVIAHGSEDFENFGRLALRGGSLTGAQLGEWLDAARTANERRDRQRRTDGRVAAVLLCACTSAAPPGRRGTMGMAAHLAGGKQRARAALGFRTPVVVDWAMSFMNALFEQLATGAELDAAVAQARRAQPVDDLQWALPVLYVYTEARAWTRRPATRDDAPYLTAGGTAERRARSILPVAPRPYFTGRAEQLTALDRWLHAPGMAVLTALSGEGGIGKTEVARKLAHAAHDEGRVVIWLERPDQDPGSSLVTLIRQVQPDFAISERMGLDDLRASMRRALGSTAGLLVLDDVERAADVEALHPGPAWNVLVTTRQRHLLPSVMEIEVPPLAPDDAVELLALVAQDGASFVASQLEGARLLVAMLGHLPLAIEIAGELLRRGHDPDDMQALVRGDAGDALLPRMTRVMSRSLDQLVAGDDEAWAFVAAMPRGGVTEDEVGRGLGQPVGVAARRLFRLRQANLLRLATDADRYTMHPLAREVARARSLAAGTWDRHLAQAARVLAEVIAWCDEPIGRNSAEAWQRWRLRGHELMRDLDLETWPPGSPGGDDLARALLHAETFWRNERTSDERLLGVDAALARARNPSTTAHLHHVRGDLRRSKHDLEGADSDYARAIELHERLTDHAGFADAHISRGDLRRARGDLDGAALDYGLAAARHSQGGSTLGLAHALLALGDLERQRGEFEASENHSTRALELYVRAGSHEGQADANRALGEQRDARGDVEGSEHHFARALALFASSNLGLANTHKSRGVARGRRGDLDGAVTDFTAAIDGYGRVPYLPGLAWAYLGRGHARASQGKPDSASEDYVRAEQIFAELPDDQGLATAHAAHGRVLLARGMFEDAEARFTLALSLLEDTHDTRAVAEVIAELAGLRAVQGDLAAAIALAEQGEPLAREAGPERARAIFAEIRTAAASAAASPPTANGEP